MNRLVSKRKQFPSDEEEEDLSQMFNETMKIKNQKRPCNQCIIRFEEDINECIDWIQSEVPYVYNKITSTDDTHRLNPRALRDFVSTTYGLLKKLRPDIVQSIPTSQFPLSHGDVNQMMVFDSCRLLRYLVIYFPCIFK